MEEVEAFIEENYGKDFSKCNPSDRSNLEDEIEDNAEYVRCFFLEKNREIRRIKSEIKGKHEEINTLLSYLERLIKAQEKQKLNKTISSSSDKLDSILKEI